MKMKPVTVVVIAAASFGAGALYCAKRMGSPKIQEFKEAFDATRTFLKDKNPANA